MSRKILTIDIETSPHLVYTFQTRQAFITPIQVVEPTRMLSFAAKWHGRKPVIFDSEYDFTFPGDYAEFRNQHHREMVETAFNLLDEADVVVGYNSDRFDLRHLRREFRLANLGQPSPFHSVDLYKVIKQDEEWMSHKLAYITEKYELTGKLQNDGWALWIACLAGDPTAWKQMRRYNKGDVVTTEELFDVVQDLVSMPALNLFDNEPLLEGQCPQCKQQGQSRGHAYTKTRRYPRYYCNDCGKWFRGNKSDRSAGIA